MDMIGEQDPYVVAELGEQRVQGQAVVNGGINPDFKDEDLILYVTPESWSHNLRLSCFDEDLGRDDLIGAAEVPLMPLMQAGRGRADEDDMVGGGGGGPSVARAKLALGLKGSSGSSAGELNLTSAFYRAGTLSVEVVEARRLKDTDLVGGIDPYVKLTALGGTQAIERKTKAIPGGGSTPTWQETLRFDVVDQHELRLDVWDSDRFSADDMVGQSTFSLLPAYKKGYQDLWVPVKLRTNWGALQSSGEVHLRIRFEGPPGVAYPQRQPRLDAFDDAERVTEKGQLVRAARAEAAAAAGLPVSAADALALESENGTGAAAASLGGGGSGFADGPSSDEFTDQEIEDAFHFIDLDRNLHIGAAEVRHILVCMGEIITDEEVDEMIRMIDQDGDGQVSFNEFHRLAKHPDPASPEF